MTNPSKFYLNHMYTQTRYRATWDPTKQLQIGAVGKLEQGVLSIYSSLDKEGIPIQVATGDSGASMDYTSHDSVNLSVKLAGAMPIAGSALTESDCGFSFDFKGEQGVVFQTSDHRVSQLVNLAAIEDSVLDKYNSGNWSRDWVIVTELITATAATIIISNSSNGALELKANGSIAARQLTLTDTSLGLSVIRERGSTLKYIAQKQVTPLYRVMGLKAAFLSKLSMGARTAALPGAERLELLEYSELELQ